MVDVNIKRIEDSVGNIGVKQICIETGNDSQTGYRMMGYKDGAGDTYKVLAKGKPAYIQNLNISEFTTAGLLRTTATGVIYGDVNSLGELNTALGGTTIDESTDTRPPDAHASDHTDGTDDIQDATASQKGLMTAAQAAQVIQNVSDISDIEADAFFKSADSSDDVTEGATNLYLTNVERAEIADALLKSTDTSDDVTEGTTNLFLDATEKTYALRQEKYASIGDSITSGDGYPYTVFLNAKYDDKQFYNYGVGGEYATALVNKQLLQAAGMLSWRFREAYYPWTLNSITAAIVDETLEIEQPASGYLSLACLPIGEEVTIRGNFQTATLSRLKVYSASAADILTTTATGDFEVTYTAVADREEIRITTVSGTTGDAVYLNNIEIELTDRSTSATNNGKVFIMAGINDVIANVEFKPVVAALLFCAETVSKSGAEPVLMLVTPFGGATQYTAAREAVRVAINEWIENSGYSYVDTSDVGYDGSIKTEYEHSSADGLHFNPIGQEVIGKAVDRDVFGFEDGYTKGYSASSVRRAPFAAKPADIQDKQFITRVAENMITYSEQLNDWQNLRLVDTANDEITAEATDATHGKIINVTIPSGGAGNYILRAKFKVGDQSWVRLENASIGAGRYGHFDIANLVAGTMSTEAFGNIYPTEDGYFMAELQIPFADGTNQIGIYPRVDDSDGTYVGDSVTPNLYCKNVQVFTGTLGDDKKHVETVAKPFPEQEVIDWVDNEPYQGKPELYTPQGVIWEYANDQWGARVDTVIQGQITIPSGTSIGTWTSDKFYFNGGNSMMLNDTDVMMLDVEENYTRAGDASTRRSTTPLALAPEAVANTGTPVVLFDNLGGISDMSAYVNSEETYSGIVYAEIAVTLTTSPPSNWPFNFKIRLKGELMFDNGLRDC